MGKIEVLLSIIVVTFLVYKWMEAEYQYKQQLRWYANRIDPIIEWSKSPRDDGVEERANYHREMLKKSGNKWNIPVYEFAYPDVNRQSEKWVDFHSEYLRMLAKHTEKIQEQWSVNIRNMDQELYMKYMAGQKTEA